jgi:predicted CoA-binding protein
MALLDEAGIAAFLASVRRIAVVGASANAARPSHDVFRTLVEAARGGPIAAEGGLAVVMDRCTAIELRLAGRG